MPFQQKSHEIVVISITPTVFSYRECAINRGGRSGLVYVLEDNVLRSPLLMRDGRRNNGERGNGEKVHGIFIEIWEKMFEIEVFFSC